MSWESIDWTPAEGGLFEALPPIKPMWPLIKSALEESIAAMIQGPASIGEVTSAEVDADVLPSGFVAVASIELLGTERRDVWAAIDPSAGSILAGEPQTAAGLQTVLLEALDGVLQAIVGEGLAMTPPDSLAAPSGRLLVLRLPITDGAGAEVVSVLAVDSAVPGELAAHVLALKALTETPPPVPAAAGEPGGHASTTPPPSVATGPVPSPAPAAPVAIPAAPPAPVAAVPEIPTRPLQLPELTPAASAGASHNIELLLGVNLEVSVEIGRTRLPIRDVLGLAPGSVVELDKLAGEKVDVLVNGRAVASGEVVVVDENFGVRITDVVSRHQRILTADAAR